MPGRRLQHHNIHHHNSPLCSPYSQSTSNPSTRTSQRDRNLPHPPISNLRAMHAQMPLHLSDLCWGWVSWPSFTLASVAVEGVEMEETTT
ncbi:hypothetical protein BDZ97DRAFT_1828498 [Flammula alnicola]|nr:hypothetical protein BDZ97DRAFT_1828498 [Flammula alnicola]